MAQRQWQDKEGYTHTLVYADSIDRRLDEIRKAINEGNVSYGELAELQTLVDCIDEDDVVLLEAAGVAEHN